MSARANRLRESADQQIGALSAYVSTLDDLTARRPCPGREKLGDGSVAAAAMHTADNYARIAAFAAAASRGSAAHRSREHGAPRLPRFLRVMGHRPPEHAHRPPDHTDHNQRHGPDSQGVYRAESLNLDALLQQLRTARGSLQQLGDFSDSQLTAIPPEGSFRFCDGQRNLEQVLAALLKHQQHQVDALIATTDPTDGRAD